MDQERKQYVTPEIVKKDRLDEVAEGGTIQVTDGQNPF